MTRDVDQWSFHTAVAHVRELHNEVQRRLQSSPPHADVVAEAIDTILLLMAPMAPHVTAELWQTRHPDRPSVHEMPWPAPDASLLDVTTSTLVVQVDGKVRDRIEVGVDVSEEDAVALALASGSVTRSLDGRAPRRVIARPPRLVNIVT